MNYSVYRASLDMHDSSTQVMFNIKKNDSGRQMFFTFMDGGKPYKIADGCYARLRAKKPDGTILYNECEIVDNSAIYTLTNQTSNVDGMVECEITLYDDSGKQITSPRFSMCVDNLLYEDAEVESKDEFTALSTLSGLCFIGTKAEVDEAIAQGKIKDGWLVIITDDYDESISNQATDDLSYDIMNLKMLGYTVPKMFKEKNYIDENGLFHSFIRQIPLYRLDNCPWSGTGQDGLFTLSIGSWISDIYRKYSNNGWSDQVYIPGYKSVDHEPTEDMTVSVSTTYGTIYLRNNKYNKNEYYGLHASFRDLSMASLPPHAYVYAYPYVHKWDYNPYYADGNEAIKVRTNYYQSGTDCVVNINPLNTWNGRDVMFLENLANKKYVDDAVANVSGGDKIRMQLNGTQLSITNQGG